jgi:hypothetical protein
MEKGLKNLNQAQRSHQRKVANDSGISLSDHEEDDRLTDLPMPTESSYSHHQYAYTQQPKRVNSIQSILQPPMGYPTHHPYPHQQ